MFAAIKSLLPRATLSCFKKYPLLGLDLGLNELRLLQLEKRAGSLHVERMVVHSFLNKNTEGEKQEIWEQNRDGLCVLVREQGLRGYPAAFALPSAAIIKKRIESSSLNENELAGELKQSFSRYFPDLPENEIHYDYIARPSHSEFLSAFVVAVRKEPVRQIIKMAQQAGLKAKVVDVDLYALARAAAYYFYPSSTQKKRIAALMYLSWPVFSFIVFSVEDLIFHHQWCVDRMVFERPLDYAEQVTQQLRSAWQLYHAMHPTPDVELLGIAGEARGLEVLALYFEEQLSREVKVVNPFQWMTTATQSSGAESKDLASRFLLCCGLALRGVV